MGRLVGTGKLILRTAFYALFIVLISCPSPLEEKLTEIIETEVKEATASEYKLTIETPENGIINLSGTVDVKNDIPLQIIANPYQSHAFVNWEKVSGSGTVVFDSPTSAETSFKVIGGNAVIKAVFEKRPIILFTTPSSESVPIDSYAKVFFSKDMDPDTINGNNISLQLYDKINQSETEPILCVISYENKIAKLKPNVNMEAFRYYSVSVSKEVKDINGVPLLEDFVSSSRFKTIGTGDTAPPEQGEFLINNGALWTSSTDVTLTNIFAQDPNDGIVALMYAKNESGGIWSDPLTYNNTADWSIPDGDGLKTIFMKFEDSAGNESDTYGVDIATPFHSADEKIMYSITLDKTSPDFENVQTTGETGIAMAATDEADNNEDPDGDMYTTTQDVLLYMNASDTGVSASGGIEMLIAQDLSFTQGEWNGNSYNVPEWEAFNNDTTKKEFTVDPGDGSKVVLVKFRDSLGNESGKTWDYLRLDQTPPEGSISINNGNEYTSSSSVTLDISATDSGVDSSDISNSEMLISNLSDFSDKVEGDWESYSTTKASWSLFDSAEGEKTVYIRFRDSLGNEMDNSSYSDTIIIDTTAPSSGTLQIDNDAATTNSNLVNLTITAEDSASGIAEMMISNTSDFSAGTSAWTNYSTTYQNWNITDGNSGNSETKTVYIKFRDSAGNEMSNANAVYDSIYVDIPPGTFNINSGAAYTNSTSININMYQFSPGGTYKIASTEAELDSATSYPYGTDPEKTHVWTLTGTQGTKTVWVRFVESNTTISHTIELDTIFPSGDFSLSGSADDNTATNQSYVSINSSVTDTNSLTMRFKNESGGTWTSWENYNPVKSDWYLYNYNTDGNKTVYAEYKDAAGNVTSRNHSIILDKTVPVVSYFRIGGTEEPSGPTGTNTASVTLYSSVSDANGVYQMRIGNYPGPFSDFEAYTATRTAWSLLDPGIDGTKKIYCYYKDKAGNTTNTLLNDTITLDTTPPSTSVIVNSGAAYSTSLSVTALMTISGDNTHYQYSDSENGDSAWIAYTGSSVSKTITFTGDGTKTVSVRAKDALGNTSEWSSDSITIDTDTPSTSIIINSDSTYSTSDSRTVTAATTITGDYAYLQFYDSTNGYSGWISYTGSPVNRSISFTSDGSKTIYVQAKDAAGHISGWSNDSIIIDTVHPNAPTVSCSSSSTDTTPTWTWSAGGGGNGTFKWEIGDSTPDNTTTSTTYTVSANSPLPDGTHTMYVKETDDAGNLSSYGYKSFVLNITGISPDNGQSLTASSVTIDWPNPILTYTDKLYVGTYNTTLRRIVYSEVYSGTQGYYTSSIPVGTTKIYWYYSRTGKVGTTTSPVYQFTATRK